MEDETRESLWAAAWRAYSEGRLKSPPRAKTVRDPSVYEQELPGEVLHDERDSAIISVTDEQPEEIVE